MKVPTRFHRMNDEQLAEEYLSYKRKSGEEEDHGYDAGPDIVDAILARCGNDFQGALRWIEIHSLAEQCVEGMAIPIR